MGNSVSNVVQSSVNQIKSTFGWGKGGKSKGMEETFDRPNNIDIIDPLGHGFSASSSNSIFMHLDKGEVKSPPVIGKFMDEDGDVADEFYAVDSFGKIHKVLNVVPNPEYLASLKIKNSSKSANNNNSNSKESSKSKQSSKSAKKSEIKAEDIKTNKKQASSSANNSSSTNKGPDSSNKVDNENESRSSSPPTKKKKKGDKKGGGL